MKKSPRVSVILPTYNRAYTLHRSINSVLCQTYQDFNLIVVDDASMDDTEDIVNYFKDERIIYKKLSKNVGGAGARNIGLQLAQGEYVAFQDSDDEWTCMHLHKSIASLDVEDDVGAVFSDFIQIGDFGCRMMPIWMDKSMNVNFYETLLWRNVVGTPTLVARRSALESVGGFDESMPRYQDWELVLRLAKVVRFKYRKEPSVLSYVHEDGISQNSEAHLIALEKIYEKHVESINKNPSLMAAWLNYLGDAKVSHGLDGGRRLLLNAALTRPTKVSYVLKAVLSLCLSSYFYNRVKNIKKIIFDTCRISGLGRSR